jgi:hypothetical protein
MPPIRKASVGFCICATMVVAMSAMMSIGLPLSRFREDVGPGRKKEK